MKTLSIPAGAVKVDRRKAQEYQGPWLSGEEAQARCDAYRASLVAQGRQVGGITLDAHGNAYEWLSWERMMSE